MNTIKIYVYIFMIILFVCAGAAGLSAGYKRIRQSEDIGYSATEEEETGVLDVAAIQTPLPRASERSFSAEGSGTRISAATKMIYEYYYADDGKLEQSIKEAPYYVLGMTKDDISGLMGDWKLLEFTADQVVMRKNIQNRGFQNFTLGIQNGYVAVFYNEGEEGLRLKEITDTPINALSPEECERLAEGIQVNSYDRLIRLLEDYGS